MGDGRIDVHFNIINFYHAVLSVDIMLYNLLGVII